MLPPQRSQHSGNVTWLTHVTSAWFFSHLHPNPLWSPSWKLSLHLLSLAGCPGFPENYLKWSTKWICRFSNRNSKCLEFYPFSFLRFSISPWVSIRGVAQCHYLYLYLFNIRIICISIHICIWIETQSGHGQNQKGDFMWFFF